MTVGDGGELMRRLIRLLNVWRSSVYSNLTPRYPRTRTEHSSSHTETLKLINLVGSTRTVVPPWRAPSLLRVDDDDNNNTRSLLNAYKMYTVYIYILYYYIHVRTVCYCVLYCYTTTCVSETFRVLA